MASQRVDVVSKANLVINFISNVIQILLLIKFRNYYVYVVVLPVFTCINNVIVAVLTKKYYPQYVCRGKITKEEFKLIQKKVGGLLFQRIGNIVLCNVDTLVISGFLGLRLLGIYNGYYYVISALMGFLSVIQQALIPSVGNSIVKEDKIKNYKDFCKFHFMYLWIVSWCTTCILVLYQPFIKAWQGESNMLGMDMVILMSIYFFVYKMGDMSYIYKEAIGLWWEGKYVPLVSSIVNLVLNIMLVKIIGLPGIVISTIFSASLVNTPFGSRVLFKHYFESKMNWIKFLFATVLWFVKCTIACTVTYLITNELPQNILGVLLKLFFCVLIPNVVFVFLNIKSREFKEAVNFVRSIIKKKNINCNAKK
jgi:O-antigen/teichoic acid export membrane protein